MIYSENKNVERNKIKIDYTINFYQIEGQEHSSLIIESEILDEYFYFERLIGDDEVNEILNKYFNFLDILLIIENKKLNLYKDDLIKNNFTKNQYKILVKYLVDSMV